MNEDTIYCVYYELPIILQEFVIVKIVQESVIDIFSLKNTQLKIDISFLSSTYN